MKTKTTKKRFNWRGNRPRMGKRSMCASCGTLSRMKVKQDGAICFYCGEPAVYDVSYDD